MNTEVLLPVVSTIIGLLLAGNVFFIKRLIDKIDLSVTNEKHVSSEISKLGRDVNAIGGQLRDFKSEIKADIKELRRIEIDVAVLKSQLNNPEING